MNTPFVSIISRGANVINFDMDIVAEMLHQIREQVGEEVFSCWFQEKVKLSFRNNILVIDSYMPYVVQWNRRTYKNEIIKIASRVAGCAVKVEFRAVSEEEFFRGAPACPENEKTENAGETRKKKCSAAGKTSAAKMPAPAGRRLSPKAAVSFGERNLPSIPQMEIPFTEPAAAREIIPGVSPIKEISLVAKLADPTYVPTRKNMSGYFPKRTAPKPAFPVQAASRRENSSEKNFAKNQTKNTSRNAGHPAGNTSRPEDVGRRFSPKAAVSFSETDPSPENGNRYGDKPTKTYRSSAVMNHHGPAVAVSRPVAPAPSTFPAVPVVSSVSAGSSPTLGFDDAKYQLWKAELSSGKFPLPEVSSPDAETPRVSAPKSRTAKTVDPSSVEAMRQNIGTHGNVHPSSAAGTFQTFISGPANHLAVTTARQIIEEPSTSGITVFYGETGVGKTHLLDAVRTAAVAAGWNVESFTANDFTAEFVQAISTKPSKISEFRRRLRNAKLLIIDDIQVFLGKEATSTEFLNTLDMLSRQKKHVVLSCSRPLSEMTKFAPDLISRLHAGLWCPVPAPCQEIRLGIVNQLIRQRNLNFPLDVRRRIAQVTNGDGRKISGLINQIAYTARGYGRGVDMPLLEEVLAGAGISAAKPVVLEDIKNIICEFFGLETAELVSGGRSRAITQPRMLAMWLARKFTKKPLSEIGQSFGCSSHSTVISAQKKIDQLCSAGTTMQMQEQTLDVNDIIQRIEHQLRSV